MSSTRTGTASRERPLRTVRASGIALLVGGLALSAVLFVALPGFGWLIAPFLAVVSIAVGWLTALRWNCSACQARLSGGRVRSCPDCGVTLAATRAADRAARRAG